MEENTQIKEKKLSNGCLWIILVAIAMCVATAIIVFRYHEPINSFIHPCGETQDEYVTESDSIDYEEITVQDYMESRNAIKESIRIDSVYLAIPDSILEKILINHGTSLSNTEIVNIYESNPEYNNPAKKYVKLNVSSNKELINQTSDSLKTDMNKTDSV